MCKGAIFSSTMSAAKLISLSKCSVLPTNALFFNFFMWSKAMMLKLDVALTPSEYACRAQKGSHHTSTITTESGSAILAVSAQ